MEYKPLGDYELLAHEAHDPKPDWGIIHRVFEQARRANRLAAAVVVWDFHEGPWADVASALADYEGGKNDTDSD